MLMHMLSTHTDRMITADLVGFSIEISDTVDTERWVMIPAPSK